jgi:hypothetical protein
MAACRAGAHPAWWRGCDHGVMECAKQVGSKLGVDLSGKAPQELWHAVMPALERVADLVREDAGEPCHYGDGCPPFARTSHGACRSCKARRALNL